MRLTIILATCAMTFLACGTDKAGTSSRKLAIPVGTTGHIDTSTTRALEYHRRSESTDNGVVDTSFTAQFGGGQVTVPLDVFYGPQVAGQTASWSVDGRGRVATGDSAPPFLMLLEAMPDGPLAIGTAWSSSRPTDAEAAAATSIVLQLRRDFRVVSATEQDGRLIARVEVDGFSRFVNNSALQQTMTEMQWQTPSLSWRPQMTGTVDVDLTTGTVLGMRFYEEMLSDAASTADLSRDRSESYCLDTSFPVAAGDDLCGWNP